MKKYLARLILILLAFVAKQANATHIVGGEVTYQGDSNYNYRIRVDIYQDCLNGDPQAISQDNPGIIAIFQGNGSRYRLDSTSYSFTPEIVPPNFSNACINNPPATCLRKASFVVNYYLPPNTTGYYIVYQRCCRNVQIVNIIDPGSVGATYKAFIPPAVNIRKNNSAVFKNYPPQIICINNPIVYDHSATDADGDSLSYEFCTAYTGGSDRDAKPIPNSINFAPVNYAPPYSAVRPMQGSPMLQIDAVTGMLTGTPTRTGRYVVTVCCHEWREGIMINTVTREFQFVVTNCSKAVVANIPQYSTEFNTYIVNCKSHIVHFDNLSTGGFAYSWDFGVPGIAYDTSNAFEPTYTYADTGTYLVKLVVNRGSTCPDSISRYVKVYPDFASNFSISGLPCPNGQIQFTDLSTSTFQPINEWSWDFGDGKTSNLQNPVHIYDTGGKFNVVFISKNFKGCTDTLKKDFEVEKFKPYSGIQKDTLIVKGEHINFRGSGGIFYTWTPATYLDNPNIANPIGYYPDTTRIQYIVHVKSEVGCEGNDTIGVWVVNQATLYVPTGFTPNGDGINDILRPIGIGYSKINYFRVYNRWGQVVFYTVYFGEGWDGTMHGKPCDIGTYFWQLSTINRFGVEEKIHGDATLIR